MWPRYLNGSGGAVGNARACGCASAAGTIGEKLRGAKASALAPWSARAGTLTDAPVSAGGANEKLAALYQYLAKPEATTDWLAKLYAIGHSTGVELAQASYKSQSAPGGKLERYEIVLPLTGSYTQMREFLKRSLAEVPVLSLDQISLKRENRRDGTVQAELRLTLHMVKP